MEFTYLHKKASDVRETLLQLSKCSPSLRYNYNLDFSQERRINILLYIYFESILIKHDTVLFDEKIVSIMSNDNRKQVFIDFDSNNGTAQNDLTESIIELLIRTSTYTVQQLVAFVFANGYPCNIFMNKGKLPIRAIYIFGNSEKGYIEQLFPKCSTSMVNELVEKSKPIIHNSNIVGEHTIPSKHETPTYQNQNPTHENLPNQIINENSWLYEPISMV